MHKFTCVVCGKEFLSERLGRLHCSKRCNKFAFRNRHLPETRNPQYICNYNEGVDCRRKSCGWSPDVIKERLRRLGG